MQTFIYYLQDMQYEEKKILHKQHILSKLTEMNTYAT